jgi:mannose-6-phosphate isomerase-like protein (cupin superfamily)
VFCVLAGTMSLMVDEWFESPAGSFVLVPRHVTHDVENRGAERAGLLNVSVPGDFESEMPGIAQWFLERSAADARA